MGEQLAYETSQNAIKSVFAIFLALALYSVSYSSIFIYLNQYFQV